MIDPYEFAQKFSESPELLPSSMEKLGPRRLTLLMLRLLGVNAKDIAKKSQRSEISIRKDWDAIDSHWGVWRPAVIAAVIMRHNGDDFFDKVEGMPALADFYEGMSALSTTQLNIVREVALNKNTQEVMKELRVSEGTVANGMSKVYGKTGTDRNTFMLAIARHTVIVAQIIYGDLSQYEIDRASTNEMTTKNPWMGIVLEPPRL